MDTRTYSFIDLIDCIIDNRGRTCPVENEGIPLIATNCIKDDTLYPVFEKVRYVSPETYSTWFRGHPEPGDIIFVNKGSPGRVCLVPDPVNFCMAQDMVALRVNREAVDPLFLFALLRSETVQKKIQNMHVGTLIPHFKKGDFKNLELTIPKDKKLQKYIGNMYYFISQKIELNQKLNQHIEELAMTIFKSWFVNFDPVKAKITATTKGKDPEIEAMCAISGKSPEELKALSRLKFKELAETATLFPSEMTDTGLEKIPKGWRVIPLENTAEYINGAAFKNTDFCKKDIGMPIIKIAELKQGINQQTKFTDKMFDDKYLLINGDVLYSWSGSPETSLEVFKWFGGEGWLNQHIFKLTFQSNQHRVYVYYLLKYLKPLLIQIARNKQTIGLGHITRKDMKELMVIFPSKPIFDIFFEKINCLYEQDSNLTIETNKLSQLRDALLPKLLSGEIEPQEIEEALS